MVRLLHSPDTRPRRSCRRLADFVEPPARPRRRGSTRVRRPSLHHKNGGESPTLQGSTLEANWHSVISNDSDDRASAQQRQRGPSISAARGASWGRGGGGGEGAPSGQHRRPGKSSRPARLGHVRGSRERKTPQQEQKQPDTDPFVLLGQRSRRRSGTGVALSARLGGPGIFELRSARRRSWVSSPASSDPSLGDGPPCVSRASRRGRSRWRCQPRSARGARERTSRRR